MSRTPVTLIRSLIFIAVAIVSLRSGAFGAQSYDWWWVFYEHESTKRFVSDTVRPFFLRNTYGDRVFEASLMPIVYWKYKTPRTTEWKSLFGLVDSVDHRHRSGLHDYDFAFFPFLYWGHSSDQKENYFMFWPFGGRVYNKLGQDRIDTVLFPGFALFFLYPPTWPVSWTTLGILVLSFIPLYVDYENRQYQAWGILWPLIQRGANPKRDDVRVLPFYAHSYKKDRYDAYNVLLLFNYTKVYLRDDVQKTLFVLPFYGRRWNESDKVNSSTLLWPFFSWGYDRGSGAFEVNFPWPLVQYHDSLSPFVKKRIFFPFYGLYEREHQRTRFITPLYISLQKFNRRLESEYNFYALIFWHFKRDYKLASSPVYGKSWRYWKLWPLFQYEYDDRGNVAFNMLSILPFRDPDGYERLYQPFWTLFEYRRLADGEKRLGLLLRLYYQRWGDDFLYIKVPFLISYGRAHGRITELSVLLSMFAYVNDERGRYVRLFWIPVGLGGAAIAVDGAANTPTLGATAWAPGGGFDDDIVFHRGVDGFDALSRDRANLYGYRHAVF
ncbi:MAG TPA: hypothetical protein PKM65_13340 [Spirochaetota bacterium]|nr:hypothetical protein [Spirochaetota bacterium]HNT11050.1 hypothetical protein [Spirochaetota bacterium]